MEDPDPGYSVALRFGEGLFLGVLPCLHRTDVLNLEKNESEKQIQPGAETEARRDGEPSQEHKRSARNPR